MLFLLLIFNGKFITVKFLSIIYNLLAGLACVSGEYHVNVGDCNSTRSLCPNDTFNLNCSVIKTSNDSSTIRLLWRVILEEIECQIMFDNSREDEQKCFVHVSNQEDHPACNNICKAQLLVKSSTYYYSVITILNIEEKMKVICVHPAFLPQGSCIANLAGKLLTT